MRKVISLKSYMELPGYDRREILRYAGTKEENEDLRGLIDECLTECRGVFTPRVCWTTLTATEFFDRFQPREYVKTQTEGCENITVFAATVGLGIDRLIHRYANVSTVKALLFQAIGAERIECLCDVFCSEQCIGNERAQKRFSPGYGDFPLDAQNEIFALLNPQKYIGVTLTESLLMSPTKSVTGAFGLKNTVCDQADGRRVCEKCGKEDCVFKRN